MSIGAHTVSVLPPAGGSPTDISCLVDSVSINHGRSDADSPPDAQSCTVEISLDTLTTALPPVIDIGAYLFVSTKVAGMTLDRFSGQISDISQGWDDAGAATPDHAIIQVVAMGYMAMLGRRVVGDVPWPQELDGARVARIMQAAGITLNPSKSDPGTVQLIPRDVDAQTALDLVQEAATDSGGMLWYTRSGGINYADAIHRRGASYALVLDSCDILVTPTWQRNTEALINKVSIGYGVPPDGGDQLRYQTQRDDLMTKWGTWDFSTSTQLAALADAQAMGLDLVTRYGEPVWILSALPIDVKSLSDADTQALLGLEIHSLINVTGMPAAGSVPTSAALWVEGWTETLTWAGHDLELVVSGFCRTAPAPWWNDVPDTQTWDSTAPALTWDSVSCLGPPVNQGRWDDQPATLRWNQIPPATTWDNYVPTD